jgi:hypothetical protein
LQRLILKASRKGSAKGLPYKNNLLYPMCQKRILSRKWFLFSKLTRVSRQPLGKMQNFASPSGTVEQVFLMHVSSALDAIKKRGTFKAYKEAHEAYGEQQEAAKQAKADLALFTAPASKGEKASKKASKKASEKASKKASGKNRSEKEKASQKIKEGVALSNTPA